MRDLDLLNSKDYSNRIIDWMQDYAKEHKCDEFEASNALNKVLGSPLIRLHNMLCAGAMLLDRIFKPVQRWHWQRLNERGSWLSLRFWFYLKNEQDYEQAKLPAINISFSTPTDLWHLYLSFGDRKGWEEEDVTLSCACGLFGFWISLEGFIPSNWLPEVGRKIGIHFHDAAAWIMLWAVKDSDGSDTQHWWQEFSIFPLDILFGKRCYSTKDLREEEATISMPEGEYSVKAKIYEAIWQRPRWPFAQKIIRADIEPCIPIPIPGKGENDWDCGEDAIYSLTCPATNAKQAADRLKASAMERRRKYGGEHWLPANGNVNNDI